MYADNSQSRRWLARLLTGIFLATLCGQNLLAAKKKVFGFEFTSNLNLETRLFQRDPTDNRQHGHNLSLAWQGEFYKKWRKSRWSLTITPFIRYDQHDRERSHADLRTFIWHKTSRRWEFRAGIGKVFWGVTESQHLVDIVNQTDAVESPDGEEKLGQPMLQLILKRKWGTLDLFVLPGFRDRTFAGPDGRLRPIPWVDTSLTQYESSRKHKHVDYAFRWSKSIRIWDIGISGFTGTSRDPRLVPGTNLAGQPVLIPIYDQIDQLGLDLQATVGSWLWKLELIRRHARFETYTAVTGGFEYTKNGFMKTRADVGFLLEYLYDNRNDPLKTPFEKDIMLGSRITFNDTASSALLFGVILDTNTDERLWFVEFSRRLKDSWKLSIEARINSGLQPGSALYPLRNDDHVQVELIRYF